VPVGGPTTDVTVGWSAGHNCALLDQQNLRCWGWAGGGLLGYGNNTVIGDTEPAGAAGDVPIGAAVLDVEAGRVHTCAIVPDGNIRCWGHNQSGGLGYGHVNNIGDNETPASQGNISVGGFVIQVAPGDDFTCALLDSQDVRCWGRAYEGQLGSGDQVQIGDNELPSSAPTLQLGGPVAQITANQHACALLESGEVRCWGPSSYGELGYGNTETIGDDEVPADLAPVEVF
jgi:alpha-tubulin suppressor-like RCC1 family protein